VVGVALQRHGGEPEQLRADLTVDATGRSAQSPKWLEALGYARPAESAVKVNVGYASRFYPRKSSDGKKPLAYLITSTPPLGKRNASQFPPSLNDVHGTITKPVGW
jgi:hypothetical protein